MPNKLIKPMIFIPPPIKVSDCATDISLIALTSTSKIILAIVQINQILIAILHCIMYFLSILFNVSMLYILRAIIMQIAIATVINKAKVMLIIV